MKTTVSTGKTLDAAVNNGLAELGLTREQAEVKVLQEGGFLKSFKVEVTEKPSQTQKIQNFLAEIIAKMGVEGCTVTLTENEDTVALVVEGDNANAVIGHRGEVLDALQYLCSLLLNEKGSGFQRVTIDAEGYRAKREKTLQKLALNLEQKVKRTGKPVNLEPMNPYERRIIHTALQNSKYVTTESDGQGTQRHVVISPINQSNVLNSPNAPRKTLNFVYRSEKKKRR